MQRGEPSTQPYKRREEERKGRVGIAERLWLSAALSYSALARRSSACLQACVCVCVRTSSSVLASYERCFRAEWTNDWAPKTTETQKKTAVPLAEPQRLSAAQRAMLRAAMPPPWLAQLCIAMTETLPYYWTLSSLELFSKTPKRWCSCQGQATSWKSLMLTTHCEARLPHLLPRFAAHSECESL